MNDVLPTYTVRPARDGCFTLTGPLLPHTLRYFSDADALSYGHHVCRETGGRIVLLDIRGRWLFTEHAQAEDTGLRILNEFRAGGK